MDSKWTVKYALFAWWISIDESILVDKLNAKTCVEILYYTTYAAVTLQLYRWFPSYLLCTFLLFPFYLLPSPVHPTGFSYCFFPDFITTTTKISSFRQTYVLTFKYFLVIKAQWNYLHSFFSLILCNFFGFVSKFKIFIKKLALFRVRD